MYVFLKEVYQMQKSKANVFVTAFIIILISFTSSKYVYAKNSEIKDNWNVTITNDAKEINDTHKIKFEVQKNKNVVLGKIAPGMKATAEIEINLQKVNGFVDIELEIDNDIFSYYIQENEKENELTQSQIERLNKIREEAQHRSEKYTEEKARGMYV